jgi:hypothetical protein
VEYESLDARGEGAVRWKEAGRPTIPSLVLAERVIPILHVSQLAKALGLPTPAPPPTALLAWQTLGLLQTWVERLRPLDWQTLTRPTPARGRSLRNLTVNVFHPFELLRDAWEQGRFDWDPDGDDEREQALQSAEALIGYVEQIERAWADFVVSHEEELERRDPVVDSPRGELTYAELLESQLSHADFHTRQLTEFLEAHRT